MDAHDLSQKASKLTKALEVLCKNHATLKGSTTKEKSNGANIVPIQDDYQAYEDLKTNYNSLLLRKVTVEEENKKLRSINTQFQAKLHESKCEIDELKSEMKHSNLSVSSLKEEISSKTKYIESSESKLASIRDDNIAVVDRFISFKKLHDVTKSDNYKLLQQLKQSDKSNTQLQVSITDNIKEIHELNNTISDLQISLYQKKEENNTLNIQNKVLENTINILTDENTQLRQRMENKSQQLMNITVIEESNREEIKQLQNQLVTASDTIQQAYSTIQDLTNLYEGQLTQKKIEIECIQKQLDQYEEASSSSSLSLQQTHTTTASLNHSIKTAHDSTTTTPTTPTTTYVTESGSEYGGYQSHLYPQNNDNIHSDISTNTNHNVQSYVKDVNVVNHMRKSSSSLNSSATSIPARTQTFQSVHDILQTNPSNLNTTNNITSSTCISNTRQQSSEVEKDSSQQMCVSDNISSSPSSQQFNNNNNTHHNNMSNDNNSNNTTKCQKSDTRNMSPPATIVSMNNNHQECSHIVNKKNESINRERGIKRSIDRSPPPPLPPHKKGTCTYCQQKSFGMMMICGHCHEECHSTCVKKYKKMKLQQETKSGVDNATSSSSSSSSSVSSSKNNIHVYCHNKIFISVYIHLSSLISQLQ